MKKALKSIVCVMLVAALVASFAGCAKISYVASGTLNAVKEVKSGEWNQVDETTSNELTDEIVITEFTPGTYGGVDFQSLDDVANYYVEAYNYTKSLTAQYDENGETKTYYKLLGDESISISDILVDGNKNSTINSIAEGLVPSLFSAGTYGLVPCCNRDPNLDNNSEEATRKNDHSFNTSLFTPEDILAGNVTDNGDGTITLEIQPKMAEMSFRGDDSQGKFFESLGDIGGTVAQISVLSFSQGDATDNIKVYYMGGTGKVKIDTATKEIVEADYTMEVQLKLTHANIAIIKDKSGSGKITYKNHYPASDDYLMQTKGITRK